MNRPHPSLACLALLAALAASTSLTGCGGGDDGAAPVPAPVPTPPPPPPPPAAALPVITTDLPATLTLREGESGSLAVTGSSPDGSPLSYRWLRNGTELPSAGTAASAVVPDRLFATSYPGETWQVELRNAAGATLSAVTAIVRTLREWLDVATGHPSHGRAESGSPGQLVSFTGPDGRVHLASVHDSAAEGALITFKGVSQEGADDAWGYSLALPASSPGAQVSHLSLAAGFSGEIVAAWLEVRQGDVDQHEVRAALYRPGASAGQAGTWVPIGAVSDAAMEASEPTVVNLGGGSFGIAWLQRSAAGQPRSAVLRRYDAPAAGSSAEGGLGSLFDIESIATDISRLQLVGDGKPMALMYLEPHGAQPGQWRYSSGAGGMLWSAAADLGADERFERFHWAPPLNGVTVLATADGNGRLFTRRVDLEAGGFIDGDWAYTANAYGSAPALLLDGEGRIDVFGVAVDTAAGHSSALGHWRYTPASGWSSATVLASSSTDFRDGLGLRAPMAGRDETGNLVLSWLQRDSAGTPQRLRVQRYSRFSDAWTNATDLAAPAVAGSLQAWPVLSVNTSGRATAAWIESAPGGQSVLRHARLR